MINSIRVLHSFINFKSRPYILEKSEFIAAAKKIAATPPAAPFVNSGGRAALKPVLKGPGTKRLKLTYDELLSRFAFNRPISVYRFPRRALPLCPQLCMGIQPGARFPARGADALTATLYGHFSQAIYRNRPISSCATIRRAGSGARQPVRHDGHAEFEVLTSAPRRAGRALPRQRAETGAGEDLAAGFPHR